MLRRTFISGALVSIGAAVGYEVGSDVVRRNDLLQSPEKFQKAMQNVRLDFVSRDLLLKLYDRTVSESDRLQLVREVVKHNWPLFIVKVPDRRFGEPGLYRLVE